MIIQSCGGSHLIEDVNGVIMVVDIQCSLIESVSVSLLFALSLSIYLRYGNSFRYYTPSGSEVIH